MWPLETALNILVDTATIQILHVFQNQTRVLWEKKRPVQTVLTLHSIPSFPLNHNKTNSHITDKVCSKVSVLHEMSASQQVLR